MFEKILLKKVLKVILVFLREHDGRAFMSFLIGKKIKCRPNFSLLFVIVK